MGRRDGKEEPLLVRVDWRERGGKAGDQWQLAVEQANWRAQGIVGPDRAEPSRDGWF